MKNFNTRPAPKMNAAEIAQLIKEYEIAESVPGLRGLARERLAELRAELAVVS